MTNIPKENGKPSDSLAMTLILGGILGGILSRAGVLWLTRRGETVLTTLRTRYRWLEREAVGHAAMAVALFGTAALAGSTIPFMQTWYPEEPTGGSSGGCGSSDSSSSSSSDGGSGCSGGGGCGGCGGGD